MRKMWVLCLLFVQTFVNIPLAAQENEGGDDLVKVKSVSASLFQPQEPPECMIDGDLHTIYHSPWDNMANTDTYFPITLTFDFSGAEQIDYLVYHPRRDGGVNGFFKEVEFYVKQEGASEYTFWGMRDFRGSSSSSVVSFGAGLFKPASIRMVVLSGGGERQGYASCAEMQFFKKRTYPEIKAVFADPSCTLLAEAGAGEEAINLLPFPELRELAREIRAGEYDRSYRVAEYKAFFDPSEFEQRVRIGKGYTRNQNVTGIFIEPGRQLVMVEGLSGSASVNVVNWEDTDPRRQVASYPLQDGLNVINHTADWSGLAYIDYSGKNPDKLPAIKVHFVKGKVNGYFEASCQGNTEWDACLERAAFPVMDAVGKYIQLTFPVADLKRNAASKGLELLEAYDRQIEVQYHFTGYTKYGHNASGNRIQGWVSYSPLYMFRNDQGVGFTHKEIDFVTSPRRLTNQDTWGLTHELGHVHQLEPYFKWGGMIEISNNLCSMYMQTQIFGYPSRLLKEGHYAGVRHNLMEDGLVGTVSKARERAKREKTVIGKGDAVSYLEVDVFQGLVPFWQLYLYFKAKGYPDFYPDLYESLRRTADETELPAWLMGRSWERVEKEWRTNTVPCQLNFVKKASQVAGVNLYPFFERYGFFVLGRLEAENYAVYKYELEETQLNLFKEDLYGLGLPELSPEELQVMLATEDER